MKKVMVHLLRHGKTEGPIALNGRTDVPVSTPRQKEIAALLLRSPLQFEQVITSPLRRCAELAQILCGRKPEPMVIPAFQEMNFGEFDGRAFDSLTTEEWAELDAFWQSPADHGFRGGEPLQDFHDRIVAGWEALVPTLEHDALIVTHGGVIRILIAHVLNMDWKNRNLYITLDIANQSVTSIEIAYYEQPYFSVKGIGLPLS